MVKTTIARFKNFAILSVLLPFVYGCGGGSGTTLASLFGGGGGGASGGDLPGGGGGGSSMVNPEPATMLLLGTGVVAMGILNSKRNQKR